MASNEATIRWIDEDGKKTISRFHVEESTTDPTTFSALTAAWKLVSNAAASRAGVLNDLAITDSASAGPYDAEDKATLQFRDANGYDATAVLPAQATPG